MGCGIAAADAPGGSITGESPYLPASVAGDARDENTEATGAAAGGTGKGQRRARGTVSFFVPVPVFSVTLVGLAARAVLAGKFDGDTGRGKEVSAKTRHEAWGRVPVAIEGLAVHLVDRVLGVLAGLVLNEAKSYDNQCLFGGGSRSRVPVMTLQSTTVP